MVKLNSDDMTAESKLMCRTIDLPAYWIGKEAKSDPGKLQTD